MHKILTFNINTKDIVLCDDYYNNKTENIIPTEGLLFKRHACFNPLFFESIRSKILLNKPELVCITTEEYTTYNYFHDYFLPKYMESNGLYYELLSKYNYNDVYMSIYVRYDMYNMYDILKYDYYTYGNNVDAVVQYVNSPYGLLSFIGLCKMNSSKIVTDKELSLLINNILKIFLTNNVNFYFVMGYLDQYNNHIMSGNVYNASKYDIIISNKELYPFKQTEGYSEIYNFTKINTKILCFSWNTDKIPLCDKFYNHDMTEHERTTFFSSNKCFNPLFFDNIKDQIIKDNPDIVTIVTEGDVQKGTFFHSNFLRTNMNKNGLNYMLLDNSKATMNDNNTLRMSIYIRNDVSDDISLVHLNRSLFSYNEESKCNVLVPKNIKNKNINITYESKSIVKYVQTSEGIIAFMGIEMLHEYKDNEVNYCIDKMQRELLTNGNISYIFILGDFNYSNINLISNDNYDNYDDMLSLYDKKFNSLLNYNEGDGNGYNYPNYKLNPITISQRENFELGYNRYDSNNVTWHDRIYHKTLDLATHDIVCIFYDTVFKFPMLNGNSEHLGVMGTYELEKVTI
jgi:hypothetical protein